MAEAMENRSSKGFRKYRKPRRRTAAGEGEIWTPRGLERRWAPYKLSSARSCHTLPAGCIDGGDNDQHDNEDAAVVVAAKSGRAAAHVATAARVFIPETSPPSASLAPLVLL